VLRSSLDGTWFKSRAHLVGLCLCIATAIIYGLILRHHYYQDLSYTFTIASAFLRGHLGVSYDPSWLNELVPMGATFYSVFPLGAVLSVLPFSALVSMHLVATYPVNFVVITLAVASTGFAFSIAGLRKQSLFQRILLATWLVFGTWYFTNMVFAGAWQIALGFAVVGQLGAIYFSLVKPSPFLAGIMFAIAVGNRTETALTGPILLAYLVQPYWANRAGHLDVIRQTTVRFLVIPVLLGLATAWYNLVRFGSILDFGYAHIPGVLKEPWYRHGIFSLYAIPGNVYAMLLQPWHHHAGFPYFTPDGFGGSILIASPFLFLLLRKPVHTGLRYWTSLLAVALLTAALWCHGNPGGWQFSYRYALILLPWLLLAYVEALPQSPTNLEIALWLLSLAINAFATYLFMFSPYIPT
jgi:hypothetical protein